MSAPAIARDGSVLHATGRDYTVTSQDSGATLRAVVTARNRMGRTTAASAVSPA